jgi:hypothetical protein
MRILARTPSLTDAAANGVVGASVNVAGLRQASMQVGGTFVGEVTIEASQCGDVWFEIYARNLSDSSHALDKKITAPGLLALENLSGLQFVRAKTTAYTSGAINACFAGIG